MNAEQFAYFVQGMLEYTNVEKLSYEDMIIKLQGIKDHAKLVFTKVTPQARSPAPIQNGQFKIFQKELETPSPSNATKWNFPIPGIDPNNKYFLSPEMRDQLFKNVDKLSHQNPLIDNPGYPRTPEVYC